VDREKATGDKQQEFLNMDHGKANGPLLIFAIVGWAPERTTCSN